MTNLQLSDLSIEDLKKTIRSYKSLDYKSCSISDADTLLRLIIKHFITQTLIFNEPILYRARKNTDIALFENVSQLIYPKNPNTLGRLNDIGESLFYGSFQLNTAILELRPKVGDEITVLESKLITPSEVPKLMEVGIRELMVTQNQQAEFLKINRKMLAENLTSEDNLKRYKIINDFLVEEITKTVNENEQYKYKGTIAIGQFYLKGNHLADGMIYPSISRAGTECIAIKPESYHKFYQYSRCIKSKLLEKNSDGRYLMHCTEESENILSNGKIVWSS